MLGYTENYKFARPLGYFFASLGILGMITAGYLMITGLSNFGSGEAFTVFVIVGGLFQLFEFGSFVGASIPFCPWYWRLGLFLVGCVLFSFSIGIMTLAQETALGSAQASANTLDDKQVRLESKIKSLDSVISGLQANGVKQSKSRFPKSRESGQAALLQAAELIEKQSQLIDELEKTRNARKQTSQDFFKKTESVIFADAKNTEFWFLVSRSFLLELSSIMMMSFATFLFGKASKPVTENPVMDITEPDPITEKGVIAVTENSKIDEIPVTDRVIEAPKHNEEKQQVNVNSSNIITEKPVTKKPKSSNRKSSVLVTEKYMAQYKRFLKMVKKGTVKISNKGVREAVKVGTDQASNFLNQACADQYLINHGPGKGYSVLH